MTEQNNISQQNSMGKDIFLFTIVLLIVCSISATALSFLHTKTKDKIEESKNAKKFEALKIIFGDSKQDESIKPKVINPKKDNEYFEVYKNDELIGYGYVGKARGYSSTLQIMVGVDKEYNLVSIDVVDSAETPGLGENIKSAPALYTWGDLASGKKEEKIENAKKEFDARGENPKNATRPAFLTNFDGLPAEDIKVDKDGGQIKAITGATITSRAVCVATTNGINKIKEILNATENK